MKWATKHKPELYDYREVEKFAWLPTKCVAIAPHCSYTEYMVWLEHYIDYQQYKRVMVEEYGHGYYEEMWVSLSNNVYPKVKMK